MEVQEIILPNRSFTEIFSDPQKKTKILKILIQTLYNLGYEQSAKELEKESNIVYYNSKIQKLKNFLKENEFQAAWIMIQQILQSGHFRSEQGKSVPDQQLKTTLQKYITQLKCLKLIKDGSIKELMLLLASQTISKQKADEYCFKMVFGDNMSQQESKAKQQYIKESIIQKCVKDQIQPRSMEKMIEFYFKLQKQGIIEMSEDGYSLFSANQQYRDPPRRIKAIKKDQFKKEIVFIKFKEDGTKFVTVGQDKKGLQIIIWETPEAPNYTFKKKQKHTFEVNQNLQHLVWIEDSIIITTTKQIYIFTEELKESKKLLFGKKTLCCQCHPVTKLLFICGFFDFIAVLTKQGQQVKKIQPTMKIRQIAFNQNTTQLFAIGATLPNIVQFDIEEGIQRHSFSTKSLIMSLKVKQNKVIIATNQFIYILSQKLQQLNSFTSPQNPDKFLLQADLFDPWLIVLSQNFNCINTLPNCVGTKSFEWAGAGTFAINKNIMISGKNELILWVSGQREDKLMMQQQKMQQQQDEINENNLSQLSDNLDSDSVSDDDF